MNNQYQYIKVIIFVLFIMLSAISWAYRQFKAHQAKQTVNTTIQRQTEEMLRTGRTQGSEFAPPPAPTMAPRSLSAAPPQQTSIGSPTVHDDARRKLQELASRRRRELEEMSRRAAGTPSANTPAQLSRPAMQKTDSRPAPAQRTSRPAPSQRAQVPQRAQPTPSRADQAQRESDRVARAAEARRRSERDQVDREQTRLEDEARNRSDDLSMAPNSLASIGILATQALRTGATSIRNTAVAVPQGSLQDWRRAIAMLEVLGPPTSMRDPNSPLRIF